MKCISCGKFKKSFIYIILSVFFLILKDSLYGFNYLKSLKEIRIFNSDTQKKFSKHILIHNTFNYFGTLIIAFFFHRYEKKYFENENNLLISRTSTNRSSYIILIHKINDKDFTTKKSFIIFLWVIIFWIIEELCIELYTFILKDLDFWMFELLIITLFHKKIFKIEIYKHQKLAILINIIPCFLKIIAIILGFNQELATYPILYRIKPFWIPLGIILFFILITVRSYINSKIKWYMDLKYISQHKLLMYYGAIGALISLIICIISSFNECSVSDESLTKYICNVTSSDKDYYIENFSVYFSKFEKIEILAELTTILLGMITFFFNKYFYILIIKCLTPVYVVFSIPIFYFIQKSILLINTLIWEHHCFETDKKIIHIKFILDISGDFVSLIGFLIYLEIIIFNFYGLNYNIDNEISKRSYDESYGIEQRSLSLVSENESEIGD